MGAGLGSVDAAGEDEIRALLGTGLEVAPVDANRRRAEETNDPGDYTRGQLMAFYEIVSLMQSQAESFSIPWTCLRSTGSIRSETCSKRRAERLALG